MPARIVTVMGGTSVLVFAVGLVSACGSSSSSGGGGGSSSSKSMELIVGTKSDDFYVTMECGAEQEAKKLGVKLTVSGPATFSVPQQKPLIDAAEISKPDALLVAPTDAKALDPDLLKVQKSSKIIFVDTASSDAALGLSRISSNNLAGGKLAADSLGKLLGGKGTVAVINVANGVSTTDQRVQGFQQEMAAKFPGITLLPEQNDDADSVTSAASFAEGDITGHASLNGIFASNVITAEGAASGIQHAHKSGKIKLATFDADTTQVADLKNGSLQLAIAQEPAVEGADAVQQGLNAIEGKNVTKQIATPLFAVTPQNMSQSSVKPYIYASSCG